MCLEKHDGGEVTYRIVGPDETDAAKGYISLDSPMARALLGKRIDDEITLEIHGSPVRFIVLSIAYPSTS